MHRREFLAAAGSLAAIAATAKTVLAGADRLPKKAGAPDWVVYPEKERPTITPEKAGLDVDKWRAWVARQKPSGNDSWRQNPKREFGVVVTRGGYLLKVFGNAACKVQCASVSKAFTSFALQLAIDEGLIKSADDPIRNYWTGEGQLDADHKRMDRGLHHSLTFFHLHAMRGGFPISNGWYWSKKQDVPQWAKWTGEPVIVLKPNRTTDWEGRINRPVVVKNADGYHRVPSQAFDPPGSPTADNDWVLVLSALLLD